MKWKVLIPIIGLLGSNPEDFTDNQRWWIGIYQIACCITALSFIIV